MTLSSRTLLAVSRGGAPAQECARELLLGCARAGVRGFSTPAHRLSGARLIHVGGDGPDVPWAAAVLGDADPGPLEEAPLTRLCAAGTAREENCSAPQVLVFDPERRTDPESLPAGARRLALPASRIFPGREHAPALFAGAMARLAGLPAAPPAAGGSGAFEAGFGFADANFPDFERSVRGEDRGLAVLSGADAAALGAAAAGCRFFASVGRGSRLRLSFERLHRSAGARIVLSEAGDALEAATMALGAGYGGVRAMGEIPAGGMRIASEAARWGAGAEVPMVLLTADPAAERLFPGPLYVPSSVGEACRLIVEAFDLSDRFQCPAAVLLDADLSARMETVAPFPLPRPERGLWRLPRRGTAFERYAPGAGGVSPRSVPGHVGLAFTALPAERESGAVREKRIAKLREKAAAIAGGKTSAAAPAEPPGAESVRSFPLPRPVPLVERARCSPEDFGPAVEGACSLALFFDGFRAAASRAGLLPEGLVVLSGLDVSEGEGGAICVRELEDAGPARCYGVRGLDDRTLPFAFGLKAANPGLRTVCLMRSVRGMSAGWLLDAARRNLDITCVLFNGGGGTGAAPEPGIAQKVLAAGGTLVARAGACDEARAPALLERCMRHRGFAFLDLIGWCREHDEPEQLERFTRTAYDLAEKGYDASDIEAARRMADEPLDPPGVGVIFEEPRRQTWEQRQPAIARWGPPVLLPEAPSPEERDVFWDLFR